MRLVELVTHDIIAPASPDEHIAVGVAQRKLRVPVTTRMDKATQAALRGVQRFHGRTATGVLDVATAAILDRMRGPSEDEAHPGSAQER